MSSAHEVTCDGAAQTGDDDYTYGVAHGFKAGRDPNGLRAYAAPNAIPASVEWSDDYLTGHRDGWNQARESLAEMAAG